MKNSKTNIKFNYEYRDAAGYKNFGSLVIDSSSNTRTSLDELEAEIRKYLFDEEFFYPYKLSIPSIHFEDWNPELEHQWYRFENLEFTSENITDERNLEEFLEDLMNLAKVPIL